MIEVNKTSSLNKEEVLFRIWEQQLTCKILLLNDSLIKLTAFVIYLALSDIIVSTSSHFNLYFCKVSSIYFIIIWWLVEGTKVVFNK